MFLFCASRNGVSAKEIQRISGVTYKTAWRMGHEIRKYMGWVDGDRKLGGVGGPVVEVDETFIGGVDRKGTPSDKFVVLGMMERGGEILSRHVISRRAEHVMPHVTRWVKPGTRIATDKPPTYDELHWDYEHGSVDHSKKEWVRGDIHTNTIEAFWGALKRGINGTYVWVSAKHLQKYLWEFEYRHNLRREPWLMFQLLLSAFQRASR
jgi:hypothetical protein